MNYQQIDYKTITFGAWLNLWFETYKKPRLSANSIRNIEQQIRLHTPQWLKDIPISKITLFDIDRALSSLTRSRTYEYTRQVWNDSFVKAEKLGIVAKNVVALSDSSRYKKQRGKALSIKEQELFINALDGYRVKWLMLFYLYTGVRRAEATALEWSDINEDESIILIRGTKTADSYRFILLTDDVKAILDGQRKQIERDKDTKYQSEHPEKVFDYSPSYVSQAFKKLCPNHHLHDLRHTYITRCAECGINVNVCQQLVGHSTPQMTMNVYTHVFDGFKRREALKFTINPTFEM